MHASTCHPATLFAQSSIMRHSRASCWAVALVACHAPRCGRVRQRATPLMMTTPDEWRAFRAQLVAGEGSADDQTAGSPQNARRLQQQSAELYEEYTRGAWAHTLSTPEPGGLLLAMPLQAILVHRLQQQRGAPCRWEAVLEERLRAELPPADSADSPREREALLQRWRDSLPFTYRLATAIADETFGRMRRGFAGAAERELWAMQVAALGMREHVCLVLRVSAHHDDEAEAAVVLSRPCAGCVDRALARRLLRGERPGEGGADGGADGGAEAELEAAVDRFVAAFGAQAAVYWGGDCARDEPALMLHGRPDMPGAVEVAPGTGIYEGGVAAAIEAVLGGEASPLDFRFFLGRHERLSTARGEWRPYACSRALVLKQAQALPTPLWHEVLGLCGGEAATLSKLVQRESGRLPETG